LAYKVDRISRSLHDFAQIVTTFDERNVSFVSVTQQFNTTTSMGRLTLNILLSFAQFEREVIGERVRDKFAASKQKGMWMGGFPPLGYDIEHRKLVVNEKEAKLVQHIFKTYLEVKSGHQLAELLNQQKHKNKQWVNRNGVERGGDAFTNQSIYKILGNPTYIGKTRHKDKVYDGQHQPVISEELWQQVQALLTAQKVKRKSRHMIQGALLAGKCFAQDGKIYTPTHSTKGRKKRYYYYIHKPSGHRINALDLESLIFDAIQHTALQPKHWKQCWQKLTNLNAEEAKYRWQQLWSGWNQIGLEIQHDIVRLAINRVTLAEDVVTIRLCSNGIVKALEHHAAKLTAPEAQTLEPQVGYVPEVVIQGDAIDITLHVSFKRNARGMLAVDGDGKAVQAFQRMCHNETLIHALAKSHRWNRMLNEGEATITSLAAKQRVSRTYISQMLNLILLAPDIVEPILNGTQPKTLKLKDLMNPMPMEWKGQHKLLNIITE